MFSTTYRDPQGRFSFNVPAGWNVQALGEQGTIVSDPGASGAYVHIQLVPGGGKSLQPVQDLLNQVGRQWKNFRESQRGDATLSRQAGVFIFFSGVNPSGVSALLRVVAAPFGDDGYMLLISAPIGEFQRASPAFKQIENSFTVGSAAAGGKAVPPKTQNVPNRPGGGPLPGRSAPKGLRSEEGPAGGRILYGAVAGAPSTQEAFQTGIARTKGYFDTAPRLLKAITSKDGKLAEVIFGATLARRAVNGLMMAAYDTEGNSHFAVMFDDPTRLSKSLPAMVEQVGNFMQETVKQHPPTVGSGASLPNFKQLYEESAKVSLQTIAFPDNTATIGIAPGFQPKGMANGKFAATNESGSYILMYIPLNMMDPRGMLYQIGLKERLLSGGRGSVGVPGQVVAQYDKDPVRAWKTFVTESSRQQGKPDPRPQVLSDHAMPGTSTGRLIAGTMTLEGKPFVFAGLVLGGGPPPNEGGWFVQVTMMASPAERVNADMPALMAMLHSMKLDRAAVLKETMKQIEQTREFAAQWMDANRIANREMSERSFQSSMANARASRDAMDRSTASFINHIRDQDVVESNQTGEHATIDSNFARALTQADPAFRVVPIADYVKGVDYN